jgi:hypothetical protein
MPGGQRGQGLIRRAGGAEHNRADAADQAVEFAGRVRYPVTGGPAPTMLRTLSRLRPMENSRFTISPANWDMGGGFVIVPALVLALGFGIPPPLGGPHCWPSRSTAD